MVDEAPEGSNRFLRGLEEPDLASALVGPVFASSTPLVEPAASEASGPEHPSWRTARKDPL